MTAFRPIELENNPITFPFSVEMEMLPEFKRRRCEQWKRHPGTNHPSAHHVKEFLGYSPGRGAKVVIACVFWRSATDFQGAVDRGWRRVRPLSVTPLSIGK
jgi:hypothetical protein